MKKLIALVFFSFFMARLSHAATQVQIISPLPLPVSATISASTATQSVVSTYTVVSTTYPIATSATVTNFPSTFGATTSSTTFGATIYQPAGTSLTATLTNSTMSVVNSTVGVNSILNTVTVQPVGITTATITNSTISVVNSTVGVNSILNALPAGSNSIGQVTQSSSTSNVTAYQPTNTPYVVQFSTNSTTKCSHTFMSTAVAISTPIAGVNGQTIGICSIILTVGTATNITFYDNVTAMSSPFQLIANGAIVLDKRDEVWWTTSAGNPFVIQQSGTANVSADIWYLQQ